MATAAFRSSSRRSSIGGGAQEDVGLSSRVRRSRSLSRYSGSSPRPQPEHDDFPTPRGRFVNKVRGSGFPEVSLDDLAEEFFRARAKEDMELIPVGQRSGLRMVRERLMADTESSRRRGRSVSRHHGDSTLAGVNEDSVNRRNARLRRSVSVARSRHCELELDRTGNKGFMSKDNPSSCKSLQKPLLHKQNSDGRSLLGRSMSQKYFQLQDNYSSHSSSFTDDEEQGARSRDSGSEKTIKAVYSQRKMEHPSRDVDGSALYEVMRKEVRNMVEELRTELEKVIGKADPTLKLSNDDVQSMSSNAVNAICELRRSYSDKLEQAWMIKM